MGVLILAVVMGSIGAVAAMIFGYSFLTALAVYCLVGLASFPLVVLPLIGVCSLRKRQAQPS